MSERSPDTVAVVTAEETWTYGELEHASDRVAAELLRHGAGDSRPVGVLTHRSVYLVAALLGILKAGLAYLPLATDESADRRRLILDAAQPSLVLGTTEALRDWQSSGNPPALDIVPLPGSPEPGYRPEPLRPVAADQPVNVIFTSGSTGTPKGVLVPSGGITNRLLWGQRRYGLTEADRVLQKTPYTFDVSGWEIYWPLIAGARLVMLAPGEHADPSSIMKALVEHKVTVCHFVPSMLAEFLRWPGAGDCTSLRHVFCSGEALPAPLARSCLRTLPAARLHNLYGPTEASIEVTFWDGPDDPDLVDEVPIGRAVDNCELLVLDEDGRPTADGEIGELCIGGVPLALGYLGRPDLTERAFVTAPPGSPVDRVYRTGDLVQVVDGQIHYHGRTDEQVKIRGVRVEPGEVEAVLSEQPLVAECAVVAAGAPAPRLVAFVRLRTAVPADDQAWQESCREHVAARLPAAYVPTHFVPLAAMPLTLSGKQDRVLLRRQAVELLVERAATSGEERSDDPLAALWCRVLGLDAVDEEVDFLAAGGHSLAAVRLRGELLRRYGVKLSIAEVLRERLTLEALRGRVSSAGPVAEGGLPRRAERDRAPVSAGQRRLWLMEQLYPRLSAYNVVAALRLSAPLDTDRLLSALAVVVERHESLRTAIVTDSSGPYQTVLDHVPTPLELRVVTEPLTDRHCRRLAADQAAMPLPVDTAPLLRVLYASDPDGAACLVAVMHHAIADQRAIDVFLHELAAAYGAALPTEEPPQLGDLLADRVVLEDPAGQQAHLAYWVDRLRDAPRSHGLPFQARRPAVTTFAGGAVESELNNKAAERLDEAARRIGVTPVVLVLAAFATVLTSWSGQDEIVVGVPWSSRDGGESDDVIGFLIDTLPVRIDVGGAADVASLAGQVSDAMIAARQHGGVDFERMVRALGLPRNLSRNPLYQVWFNDLTHAAAPPTFDGVRATEVEPETTGSLFDLGLYLRRAEGAGYRLQLVHALDVFGREVAEPLLNQVGRLLLEVPDHLARRPAGWPLGGQEPMRPTGLARRPALTGPAEAFLAAARRYPNRAALHTPDGPLTYRELQDTVLARSGRLRDAGWSGRSVLLPGDRSAGTVVDLLAAWHAGCAVALVDGSLPARRLLATLAGARAEAVLAGNGADWPVPVLTGAELPRPDSDREPAAFSHALCTSGTTGEPSVVFASPDALPEALHWYREQFATGPDDRFLLLSAPGHDPVLRDILAPLTCGATLYLPSGTGPAAVAELLAEHEITTLHATPGLVQLVASAARGAGLRLDALRRVVLSGALLTDQVARQLRRVARYAEIVHGYGCTETPQLATWLRWSDPADDASAWRRDRSGVPLAARSPWRELVIEGVGVGQLGEIVVRGRGLALGAQPAARPSPFVPDPLGEPGCSAYRTGDFGRYTPDGEIEFVGRRDRQVSIGGHRLDLAEIEVVLRGHEAVVQCAVAAVGAEVTAVVAAPGAGPELCEELRHELAAVVPIWAVPSRLVVLDELPLDHNGKVDLRAVTAHDAQPSALPASAAQDLIVEEARRQLGTGDPLDGGTNFFDAGLTSLSLLRLHERLRAHGFDVEVVDMFRYPSPRLLARRLDPGAREPEPPASAAERVVSVLRPALSDTAALRRAVRERLNDHRKTAQR